MRLPEILHDSRALLTAGAAGAVLACAGYAVFSHESGSKSPEQPASVSIDLLRQPWSMAGATVEGGKLAIRATELAIVHQDGTPGYDNPPVNYAASLATTGSFSVSVKLRTGVKTRVNVYGALPVVGDEHRAEQGTASITLDGKRSSLTISEQPDGANAEAATFAAPESGDHTVQFVDQKGMASVVIDGKSVVSTPDHGIFTGSVWLGIDVPKVGSTVLITALTAEGIDGGRLRAVHPLDLQITHDIDGLGALARRARPDLLFGTAVATNPLLADQGYQRLVGNFTSVTTENALKFQTVHPMAGNEPEDYNFVEGDAIVAVAERSGITVHGHALVFGEANPVWLQEVARNHPERLKQIMVDHIKTVVGHYKGRIKSWDVVNEPLAADGSDFRQNIWYQAMGEEYIAIALQAAHEADPAAQLWINDFGMETDDERFAAMVALVQQLRSQGVSLTGVGFQAHIDEGDTIHDDTRIDTAKLNARINTLAGLGVKVRISELDVSSESEYPVYADVVSACIKNAACVSVTTWGSTDKYGALDIDEKGVLSANMGLLWNDRYQPTPAIGLVKSALQKR